MYSKRFLSIAVLLLASACEAERVTEVLRVDRQDRKNRILRCLSDCSPRATAAKKGNSITWSVTVPDEKLAIAVERLRICGLDREPRSDLSAALSALDGSDARHAELERSEQARSIEEAIAQHPSVLSVATVLHIEPKRRSSLLAGDSKNERDSAHRGTASVVVRALDEGTFGELPIPDDHPEAPPQASDRPGGTSVPSGLDVAALTALVQGVVRGAGLEAMDVEIVRVPPFVPVHVLGGMPSNESRPIESVASADGSRTLGISLAANAVFALIVLAKLIGRMRPKATPSQKIAVSGLDAVARNVRASA